jgi:hypothetical protein
MSRSACTAAQDAAGSALVCGNLGFQARYRDQSADTPERKTLANLYFVTQSVYMNPHWAEENLQTIRILMERSALYRRALAPIMIFVGGVGSVGGIVGWQLQVLLGYPFLARAFVLYWSGVAAVAMAGAFVLVRRQALKDAEPFWSPPTKRVMQALLPAFTVGACLGGFVAYYYNGGEESIINLICIWCWAYGCGIHSAGFFMPRGMKLFGWLFIIAGCAGFIFLTPSADSFRSSYLPQFLMTIIFGSSHLAYGIYLYFTERKISAA